MGVYPVGGIAGTALLIAVLIVVRAVRRRRTRRVPDRDELLRRAALATGQIAAQRRRAQRGTMRGGGTGYYSDGTGLSGQDGPDGVP